MTRYGWLPYALLVVALACASLWTLRSGEGTQGQNHQGTSRVHVGERLDALTVFLCCDALGDALGDVSITEKEKLIVWTGGGTQCVAALEEEGGACGGRYGARVGGGGGKEAA